jgi:hypothetical protein
MAVIAAAVLGRGAPLAAAEAPAPQPKPNLGAKPPDGAVVLLACEPGKTPAFDHWQKAWKADDQGYAVVGGGDLTTRREFGSMRLHLEFNIPPGEGGKRPPAGGNSGVYIMDRYEVQILDSCGRKAGKGDCGAIYQRIPPRVNASLPAGQWQSYDIEFHAPRFDAAGKKVQPARITVVHNGVTVQDDVEVPGPTGRASRKPEVAKALLRLQDHGCPVKVRNVWLVPLEE